VVVLSIRVDVLGTACDHPARSLDGRMIDHPLGVVYDHPLESCVQRLLGLALALLLGSVGMVDC
jgi:hypothetical protein